MSIHKLLFCEKNKEKVEIGGVFMRQADVEFTVRTDLALEEREKVQGSEIPGIRVREWEKEETGIRVTEVAVCDERGEKALGKPVGMYLTELPFALNQEETAVLRSYDWPGNIRELRNAVRSAMLLATNGWITAGNMKLDLSVKPEEDVILSEDEKERLLLVKMLEQTGNNRSKTAKLLNMSRTTLYEKLKRNGII